MKPGISKARTVVLPIVAAVLLLLGCGDETSNRLTLDQGEAAARAAIQQMNVDLPGAEGTREGRFEFESIGDLDGDGVYEVSARRLTSGNMGHIGGLVFRLDGDSLVYLKTSSATERSGGSLVFTGDRALLSYRAWLPNDPHCCPSLTVTEVIRYDASTGFSRLSIDTAIVQ